MKKFITFEGGEGSGKTTQCKLLSKSLLKINEDNLLTREPGGTDFSEKIRNLVTKNNKFNITLDSELLLIYASRCDHLKKKIMPNLKNKTVICDRFIHSTLAYQSDTKNFNKKIKFIHKYFANNIMPDLTILIDISPELGIKRSFKTKKTETRFENKQISFHRKIRKNFLDLEKRSKKIYKINGSFSKHDIHIQIIDFINSKGFFKKKIPYSI